MVLFMTTQMVGPQWQRCCVGGCWLSPSSMKMEDTPASPCDHFQNCDDAIAKLRFCEPLIVKITIPIRLPR